MVEAVEMERLTRMRDVPLSGVIELNNSASSADDCKDKNYQCNYEQEVDVPGNHMESDKADEPQN